jgi:hypothetical protein
MIRKFPSIQQSRQNVILFHETIPLRQCSGAGRFLTKQFGCFLSTGKKNIESWVQIRIQTFYHPGS